MKNRAKKPFYKKWWVWTIAILLVIGYMNQPSEEEQAELKAQQEADAKLNAEEKAQKKEEKELLKEKEQAKEAPKKENEKPKEVEKQTTDEEAFKAYAANVTGSTFVKEIALVNNSSIITFYANFEDFKANNSDTKLNPEDYASYFETGEAIEKILVIENVRLLRAFPTLDAAEMNLPYEEKTYSINIDRKSLNTYLGFKVEDLKTEDDSWTEKFVNPIGYDEEKRKAIFNEFGQIN